jgi:sugar O-acyltransferase (sialic acid O-acetyltransferase NeuD family)
MSIAGFIDEDVASHGDVRDGLPVLGGWSWFEGVDRTEVRVICAVGSPAACRHLAQKARDLGLGFARAISPLAHVSPRARIGEGVTIFPQVVVNTGAHIDDHCILNLAVTVSHDCRIGRYCNLNPGVHVAGNVCIGEGCYIGMGATVIQQCSVGRWTVVGAGAAVVEDLDAHVTAVGVPARDIKRRSEHDDEHYPR